MTAETNYNLKVIVKDQANNSSIGTNIVTTGRQEKNPGGVIKDITSTYIGTPNSTKDLISGNVGRKINYVCGRRKVTMPENYSGGVTSYEPTYTEPWYVLGETNTNLYLIHADTSLTLKGLAAYNNGVGLLDSICESCFSNYDYKGIQCRNAKLEDFIFINGKTATELTGSRSYGTSETGEDFDYWPSIFIQYDAPERNPYAYGQSVQPDIYSGSQYVSGKYIRNEFFLSVVQFSDQNTKLEER